MTQRVTVPHWPEPLSRTSPSRNTPHRVGGEAPARGQVRLPVPGLVPHRGLVEKIIASRPHPEQGYRAALGIIRLAGRYGAGRAEAACARALALRAYSYRSVESILRNGLDRQPLPGQQAAPVPAHPAHANVRGPGYYS